MDVVGFTGYQTCVRKGDFKLGELAVFIYPDSLCDTTRPHFTFLAKDAKQDGYTRIKAKKLRGIVSFGLLIPTPEGTLYTGPYSFDTVCALAEGNTTIEGAKPIVREGVVVSPIKERWTEEVGRLKLKCVGGGYLEKS